MRPYKLWGSSNGSVPGSHRSHPGEVCGLAVTKDDSEAVQKLEALRNVMTLQHMSGHIRRSKTGWWFGTQHIFHNHPNWLLFFRGGETTNQKIMSKIGVSRNRIFHHGTIVTLKSQTSCFCSLCEEVAEKMIDDETALRFIAVSGSSFDDGMNASLFLSEFTACCRE